MAEKHPIGCTYRITNDLVYIKFWSKVHYNEGSNLGDFCVKRGDEFKAFYEACSGVQFHADKKGESIRLCMLTEEEANQIVHDYLDDQETQRQQRESMKLGEER